MWFDLADTLPETVLVLLVRATILLAIAGIVVRFLRRASAAQRHLVWVLALASVLASLLVQPLLSRLLGPLSVTVPLPLSGQVAPFQVQALLTVPTETSEPPLATVTAPARAVPSWEIVALWVWIGGSLLVASRWLTGILRVRKMYQNSVVPTGALNQIVVEVLSCCFTGRATSVRVARPESLVSAPMTWGWQHPVVLLPASTVTWSAEAVRAALLHEVAHIRRADWLIQIVVTLTCALYWWHPLVWWATRQAREESERACDDFVLNAGVPATDYAAHLVAVVRALRNGASHNGAAVAMAQPSGMERRVRAALCEGTNRRPVTRRHLGTGAGICLLVLGGFVCLHPVMGARPDAISFYYLPTVASQGNRNRPLELMYMAPAKNSFRDKRTGKIFRDGKQILMDFAQLALKGKAPHTGASPFAVPTEFRGATPQATLYLTASQRAEAEGLRVENKAWRALLATSPRVLSLADLEPTAVALSSRNQIVVKMTLTPSGAKKLKEFTGKHVLEVLGIVLDPDQPDAHLQMAPTIMEALTSPTIEMSGFKTLAEADRLAAHLNAR